MLFGGSFLVALIVGALTGSWIAGLVTFGAAAMPIEIAVYFITRSADVKTTNDDSAAKGIERLAKRR
jgi:hypothetical protein